MVFNPDAEYVFAAGDIAIVLGHRTRINDFKNLYRGEH